MPHILTAIDGPYDSPAVKQQPTRGKIRVALVQQRWLGDVERQKLAYIQAIEALKTYSSDLIILQELSLYPYACTSPNAHDGFFAEDVHGMSYQFACELAKISKSAIVISFYEDASDGKFNTSLTVSPNGEIIMKVRKTHIPITTGYFEDKYFEKGNSPPQIFQLNGARIAAPTCWDQWFPELARVYGLLETDLICFPTAIGSEPDHPNFDTQPLWETMMVAHGIANGMFVAAANRIGKEDGIVFYGSSFISDPYGRVILRAPRDLATILVADLHLDYKRDWLELFPFFTTRRPDMYQLLTERGD